MVKVGAIRYCLVKNSEGSRRVAGRVVEVTSETVVLSGQPGDFEGVPNAHTVPSQTGSDSLSFLSVPAGVVTAQLPSGWKKPLDLPSAAACSGMWESLGGGEVVSSQAERPLVKPAAVRKTPVAEDLDFSSLIHLLVFWHRGVEEEEDANSDESEAEVTRGCGQSKGFLRPGGNSGASSVHAYMRSGGECVHSGESAHVLCRALCTHRVNTLPWICFFISLLCGFICPAMPVGDHKADLPFHAIFKDICQIRSFLCSFN